MAGSVNQQQAVIYCRVSSRAQEEDGHGLQSQETRCREFAQSKGFNVAAVFPDTISGGGDFMKRPGMVALLSFLDAQPDTRFVVIFDDLKRFARDTRFHLDLREAFRARRASIECLNFKFDETPEGEFIETIMAAQGALERKQNGRQVAQKMKARMQSGYWVHNAPVGYRYMTVKGHGKLLVPDEPHASVVREALEGFAAGRFQTQTEVKRFLETKPDYPHNLQGEVRDKRVSDLLRQPLYAGYVCSKVYGLSWLKGQHAPLISMATFDKVQERLKITGYAPERKNTGVDFALRGFATCGDCNASLRSSWSKGKYKSYPYYACHTKGCDSYGKSIPRDKLEDAFGEVVRTLEPSPKLFALTKAMFRQAWDARLAQAKDAKRSTQRQIVNIEKQIETLLGRIMNATSDPVIVAYESKLDQLEKDKARMRENLSKSEPKAGMLEEMIELSLKFLSSPWKIWESGDIALRRTLLRLAFTEGFAYHRNGAHRTPQKALPFKALGMFSGGQMINGAEGED
ncbi:recombinase family protein [Roseobacter sp. GAI101]|uniref:recombinase family protein n=1 Tax=Roseobacter sp. (strain GAI101) TaxID=391589 RepID=UPI00018714F5|nr:recombinase family protein [Roseobacter sp. GAI101]EEB85376.1 resolvase [Roseobacter sp. GAI101]